MLMDACDMNSVNLCVSGTGASVKLWLPVDEDILGFLHFFS